MSLRHRIPVIVTIMLVLNIVILYIYNSYYFIYKVAEKIEDFSGKAVDAEKLKGSHVISELLFFEVTVLAVMIIVIGILVYFIYARPLIELSEKVKNYSTTQIFETNRKDEIGGLQNSFCELTQSLSEEKQIQNRMIASISHDIKTPLTSVLGYAESLIKKELPQERQRQYLKTIHDSAMDIEYIVAEFDSYITGKLAHSINKRPVAASYLAKMLEDEYGDLPVLINNLCDEHFKLGVDLPKIRRVFANLIKNAVKHNPEDKEIQIKITLEQADDKLLVTVCDNGKGAALDALPHLFEPFYTTENRESISGLGLSICKDIIVNHGGWITAKNADGGFFVRFWV